MSYEVKEIGQFKYIEEGEGEIILLLHGLFGALSNFISLQALVSLPSGRCDSED